MLSKDIEDQQREPLISGGEEEVAKAAEPEITSLPAKCLVEYVGTFFLVLTVALTVSQSISDNSFKDAGLAIGIILAVMIYMGGHISGAHYNPAVTLAVTALGLQQPTDALAYVAAQLMGGLSGAVMGYYITGVAWSPAPDKQAGLLVAFTAEVLFTFALVAVILFVAVAPKDTTHYYGWAIGMVVFVGATSVGSLSGGVFNPAVGSGIILVDAMFGGRLDFLWLYWLAPCVGALLAAAFFRVAFFKGTFDGFRFIKA